MTSMHRWKGGLSMAQRDGTGVQRGLGHLQGSLCCLKSSSVNCWISLRPNSCTSCATANKQTNTTAPNCRCAVLNPALAHPPARPPTALHCTAGCAPAGSARTCPSSPQSTSPRTRRVPSGPPRVATIVATTPAPLQLASIRQQRRLGNAMRTHAALRVARAHCGSASLRGQSSC